MASQSEIERLRADLQQAIREFEEARKQPDTYLHYKDENVTQEWVRGTIRKMPLDLASKYSGLSERQIARFVSGRTLPRKSTIARLVMVAEVWEKVGEDQQKFARLIEGLPIERDSFTTNVAREVPRGQSSRRLPRNDGTRTSGRP